MNLNKQLINLIGVLVVVVIVVAGIAVIAAPMFSQAQAIDGQTSTVAQTNAVYEAQVAQLTAAEQEIDDLDGDISGLRAEIPAQPKLDDVLELVERAAVAAAATIETVTAADPASWAARPAVIDTAGTGIPVAAPTPEPTEPATDETADDETDSSDAGVAEQAPAADPTAVTAQSQTLITITVAVADAKTAAAFVDALRIGPRLILPIDATFTDGTLTVQALAFIRTEDAQ